MPRIRSLKPDFFKDDDLCVHPPWIRILYAGLWIQADREGRLEDRPRKLSAEIFPYDKFNIEEGLSLLCQPKKYSPTHDPFIVRYSINGENYIQIMKFHKHQTPHYTEKPSIIPPYSESTPGVPQEHKGASQDEHESYPKSVNLTHESYQKEFDEFWEAYPVKLGKVDARKAFTILRRSVPLEEIIKAFNGYMDFLKAKRVKENFKQRPMYAATFLRSARWMEYIDFKYSAKL